MRQCRQSDQFVGWVERSETRRQREIIDGFRCAQPVLRALQGLLIGRQSGGMDQAGARDALSNQLPLETMVLIHVKIYIGDSRKL